MALILTVTEKCMTGKCGPVFAITYWIFILHFPSSDIWSSIFWACIFNVHFVVWMWGVWHSWMFSLIKCSVIYFTFIIVLCVLSLAATVCVISLNARGDDLPYKYIMPAWVCISVSAVLSCSLSFNPIPAVNVQICAGFMLWHDHAVMH